MNLYNYLIRHKIPIKPEESESLKTSESSTSIPHQDQLPNSSFNESKSISLESKMDHNGEEKNGKNSTYDSNTVKENNHSFNTHSLDLGGKNSQKNDTNSPEPPNLTLTHLLLQSPPPPPNSPHFDPALTQKLLQLEKQLHQKIEIESENKKLLEKQKSQLEELENQLTKYTQTAITPTINGRK